MIKINKEVEEILLKNLEDKLGHYSEFGAVIGDCEFVLVYKSYEIYLAHISEFRQKGIFVRLKNESK